MANNREGVRIRRFSVAEARFSVVLLPGAGADLFTKVSDTAIVSHDSCVNGQGYHTFFDEASYTVSQNSTPARGNEVCQTMNFDLQTSELLVCKIKFGVVRLILP